LALQYHVVSAGDYVVEPPDLWTSRLPKDKWGDQVPHVASQADGNERWVIGGKVREEAGLVKAGGLSADRFNEPQSWSEVPAAAHDPAQRLKAMDQDGVDVQVLFPNAPGYAADGFAAIQDPALEVACCEAYNDWILETWGKEPRFVPQCIVPISSIEAAKAEIERAVKKGHRGAVMHPFPWHVRPDLPHIHDTAWDPVWATTQDLGIPVCWEAGAGPRFMLDIYPGYDSPTRNAFDSVRRPISNAVAAASFLLGGIAERFPRLKVVFSSSSVDWIVFQLENSDWEWRQSQLVKENVPTPSEVFHRQCFVTTWFDKAGLKHRDFIGVDRILWQSEFPLSTSTYPDSAQAIERNFEGMPKDDRDKIVCGNAAALYGIQV
jgi:predicted TIM-barrel fold metal-dependent hydrolase